jgi:ribonucleotide reductase beta subunit family protein with ferritin-like domain
MTELDAIFDRYSIPDIIEAYQNRQRKGSALPLSRRLGFFPITDQISFGMFQTQHAMFWIATEAKFRDDAISFPQLPEKEKHVLKTTLGIFAFQDGDVIETLVMRFLLEAPTIESKAYYLAQSNIEAIHAWSYSLQIHSITRTDEERAEMIEAVDHFDFLKHKQALNEKYKRGNHSYVKRQFALACVEGIGFSSLFAIIFSFKHRRDGLKFTGIMFSNEKIAQDEGHHRDTAVKYVRLARGDRHLISQLDAKVYDEFRRVSGELTQEDAEEIVREHVVIEHLCADEILKDDIPNVTNRQLKQYVQYVADKLLQDCGFRKIWNVENPLAYMNQIGMSALSNFFEKDVGDYSFNEEPTVEPEDLTSVDW